MPLSCIPSKNLASEPLPVAPVVSVEASVVPVKKSISCNFLYFISFVPRWCSKPSQPLVLRSTPPAETNKLTITLN